VRPSRPVPTRLAAADRLAIPGRLAIPTALGILAAVALACAGCAPAGPPRTAPAATVAAPSAVGDGHEASSDRDGAVIVTIGDSIMAGFGLDPDEAWPALLAGSTGREVVNLGCSGAGFVAEGDCDADFSGLVDQAAAEHPSLVIVQSSDNDVDEDAATLDEATMAAVTALHAADPDARIVGMNTLWNPSWEEPEAIAGSTDALRAAVEAVGGTFVDIGQPLHGRLDLLQWDEEHPNAEGQRVLRQIVADALARAGVTL